MKFEFPWLARRAHRPRPRSAPRGCWSYCFPGDSTCLGHTERSVSSTCLQALLFPLSASTLQSFSSSIQLSLPLYDQVMHASSWTWSFPIAWVMHHNSREQRAQSRDLGRGSKGLLQRYRQLRETQPGQCGIPGPGRLGAAIRARPAGTRGGSAHGLLCRGPPTRRGRLLCSLQRSSEEEMGDKWSVSSVSHLCPVFSIYHIGSPSVART